MGYALERESDRRSTPALSVELPKGGDVGFGLMSSVRSVTRSFRSEDLGFGLVAEEFLQGLLP